MKIGDDGIEIFETLGKGGKLSDAQEKSIIGLVKVGGFKDTSKVVQQLKASSEFFRNKSGEQMGNFIDAIKQFRIYEANEYLENAIVSEWKGASINAQANRIDNAARSIIVPKAPSISLGQGSIYGIQAVLNPPEPFQGSLGSFPIK